MLFPKNINVKNLIITISIAIVIIVMSLFSNWQYTSCEKFYYENTYFFAKVSAVNIASFLNMHSKKYLYNNFSYKEFNILDYKKYENTDLFVITQIYIDNLKNKKKQKYRTDYFVEKDIDFFINNILNCFLSIEVIDRVIVVDKNGYVAYVSANYKKNISGIIENDCIFNIDKIIIPELSFSHLQSDYLSNNLYKTSLLINNNIYTKYSIVLDNNIWGSLLVFYNQNYLKTLKKENQKNILKISIILLLLGLIIQYKINIDNKE